MNPIDHCTLFPDRAFGKDWSACCKVHDFAYGAEGSRLEADRELMMCVAQTTGWEPLGVAMFAGVALFGWWFRRKGRKA